MDSDVCREMKKWVVFTETLQTLYVIVNVLSLCISLIATVCNALIVLAIIKSPSLHKPSYVLIGALAVSDFCVGFIVQPLFVAVRIAEMKGKPAIYCTLGLAYFSSCGLLLWMSCFTLVAVSIDRFLAVYLSAQYRITVTLKRVSFTILLLILAAGFFAAMYVVSMTAYYILINAVIPFCLLSMGICYFRIGRLLKQHQKRLANHNQNLNRVIIVTGDNQEPHLSFANAVRYQRSVSTVIYVYFAYLVCYLPYLGFSIAENVLERTVYVHAAYLITATIVLSNSMFNPLCYYWRIAEIRAAVNEMLYRHS